MDFELSDQQRELEREWTEYYSNLMKDAPKYFWSASHSDAYFGEGWETDELWDWEKRIWKDQNDRGYLNMHWPKEYGGRELGPLEQLIHSQIKSWYRVPSGNWAGLGLLAPSLIHFGTEEQKREVLPKILSGEMWFCQGWSEPNAGSDLASLTTRAVRDGDYYVVNGQKTWITDAHVANWSHSPIRTDPDASKRHKGISYFIYPLDTPGITVRQIYSSSHRKWLYEIFFEDARIPVKYRIGEENRGWYVTMATANSERSGASFGELKRTLTDITRYCVNTERNGHRLIEDPFIREGLADFAIEIEGMRAISYRCVWDQSQSKNVTGIASANKISNSELVHKLSRFVCQSIGDLQGGMQPNSPWAIFDGVWEAHWEADIGKITNMGTNDIQRNVIAKRALELPGE